MIKLYKAFIIPHLEYCSPLFVGLHVEKGKRNRPEDGNFYILRTLIGHNESMAYDELLTTTGIQSFYHRHFYQVLILLFKYLKGLGPVYIGRS